MEKLIALAVLLILAFVMVVGGTGWITDRAAVAEQARAEVSRQTTIQVQAQEEGKTERFEAFILGLKALSTPPTSVVPSLPTLLIAFLLGAGGALGGLYLRSKLP